MSKKALIAMSGGVDSAVAACLMKEQGYECVGATMRLFQNEDAGIPREQTCCSADDVADARSVAAALDIPHYVFNFSERFAKDVIGRFISAYEAGQTPNPCIDCNRYLKFDQLYRRAAELGCDYVVTGHYARVEQDPQTGRFLLKKAVDPAKDQSYVLYSLTQEQLSHTLFPLGGFSKTEVRALAAQRGFVNAEKRDSQDICFVPDGDYAAFITRYSGKTFPEGDFVDRSGKVLGRHKGIVHYTVGQRKGLGLALPEPLYVCRVCPENNTVVLGRNDNLFTTELTAHNINLISVEDLSAPVRVKAKIRYRQPEQWADVVQTGEDELRVVFDDAQRAITPGQAVVLYDGDTVVGGGTIGRIN